MATSAWIAARYWVCNGANLCIAFAHAYVVCPRRCREPVEVDRPFARDARSLESYFRKSASPSSPRNDASSSRRRGDACCRSRPSSRSRAGPMTNARRQIFGEAVDYALENHQRMLEANRLAEGEEPGSNVLHAAIVARPLSVRPRNFPRLVRSAFQGQEQGPTGRPPLGSPTGLPHWAPKCSSALRAPQVAPGAALGRLNSASTPPRAHLEVLQRGTAAPHSLRAERWCAARQFAEGAAAIGSRCCRCQDVTGEDGPSRDRLP